MPSTNTEYMKLITSEHASATNYRSYVLAFLQMLDATVTNLSSFNTIFNVFKTLPSAEDPDDPEPGTKESTVEDQLDKIGELIGISRTLPIVNDNIPSVLTNEYFQKILKSRILSNHWNGTIEGLGDIIEAIFPDLAYEIVDVQDMSYNINIINPSVTQTDLALLFNGYILPKPAGVGVNYTVMDKQLFGWDLDNNFIKGWDLAQWADN